MKKGIIMVLIIIGVLLLFVAGFIGWISANDYNPPKKELLQLTHQQMPNIIQIPRLHLATWNIGYAGLGSGMDFFYDGGKKTKDTQKQTSDNLAGIINILKKNESIDVWLLQEVDKKARRTYWKNEPEIISKEMRHFSSVFATNYKVPFVPVPVTEPMGGVEAGLMTLSVYTPTLCRRNAYPQIANWPESLFLLDRCFIETRIPIINGKELIVINTHNSAFVADQSLMDKELAVIRNLMMSEYFAGNYVIAAGDWNMNPYDFKPEGDYNGHRFVAADVTIGKNFMPHDWQVACDAKVPSNRHLDQSYEKGKTGATSIDFFVLSPNIKLNNIMAVDLNFEFSDHNPVFIDVELLGMYN
jgi:endonuclease/exonuclease/phosphatase family metal-dependent hydrolase